MKNARIGAIARRQTIHRDLQGRADLLSNFAFSEVVRRCAAVAALMIAGLFVGAAGAEAQQEASPPSSVVRQSLDDAWWTGPMLAPSAATLPRGHFLIEPYLYDVIAVYS